MRFYLLNARYQLGRHHSIIKVKQENGYSFCAHKCTHTKASLPVIYYRVARESFLHHWKAIQLAARVSPQCRELSDFTER